MSIPFNKLISAVGEDNFYKKYKGKRHFYIKSNKPKFENHFSWTELDNYLNQIKIGQWDRAPQLQIVLPDGNVDIYIYSSTVLSEGSKSSCECNRIALPNT